MKWFLNSPFHAWTEPGIQDENLKTITMTKKSSNPNCHTILVGSFSLGHNEFGLLNACRFPTCPKTVHHTKCLTRSLCIRFWHSCAATKKNDRCLFELWTRMLCLYWMATEQCPRWNKKLSDMCTTSKGMASFGICCVGSMQCYGAGAGHGPIHPVYIQ